MSESIGEWVSINDLNPWQDNPRQNSEAISEVAKSIKRFGFASPIIARKADNMIIAGHTRFEAAKEIGLKTVPVRFMDLDLNDAQLLALADNKLGEIALWDDSKLKDILMNLEDQSLDGLGWSNDELLDLINDGVIDLNGDPDEVPEVEENAITKEGDLWILGDHRLLCGDSTKEEDVARLMDGSQADMVFTDPPYNINYQDMKSKFKKIANDNITEEEFKSFLKKSLYKASVMYVCCSWQFCHLFRQALIEIGKPPKSMIIWNKVNPAQHLDLYFKQHEIIYYSGPFGGQKTQRGDIWELKRQKNILHPTMKPIELITIALNDHKNKKLIFDGFGGSGSTLIACEQTNRKCFMMELDQKYCDVIIRRWQNLTGKEAVHSDGQTFNSVSDLAVNRGE